MPRKNSENGFSFEGESSPAVQQQNTAESEVGFVEDTGGVDAQAGFNQPFEAPVPQSEVSSIQVKEEQKTEMEIPVETEKKPRGRKPGESKKEDDDIEYTDINKITISLVQQYSLYRRANDKVLPKRSDYIGSSVYSSRILSANKEEVEAYFPNIVGLSPNNPDFILRVKQYLNNIRIPVDELGKTFDISFYYNKKSDYRRIQQEMDSIEKSFQASNRKDVTSLRKALNEKITRINALESTKHKYGHPLNVDDYLMYRHCLLYPDVAKDMALINSDNRIRFYIKDEQKETERLRKLRVEINKAKMNYVSCLSDEELFDAIYIQYCVLENLPVISSLAEDRMQREIKLDDFSRKEPVKFNKIFINKDIKLIANIERLIARGEIIRSQYNQNLTTVDGEFVGANMSEAVQWFKHPEHVAIVNAYMNKLKTT